MAYRTDHNRSRESYDDEEEVSGNESGSDYGRETESRVKNEYSEHARSYEQKNHGDIEEYVEQAADFIRNKLGITQHDEEVSEEESSEDDDEDTNNDDTVAAANRRAPAQQNWTRDDTQSRSQHHAGTQSYESTQTYTSSRPHTEGPYYESGNSQSNNHSYTSTSHYSTTESRTTAQPHGSTQSYGTAQPHTTTQSYSTSQSYTNNQPHTTSQGYGNTQPRMNTSHSTPQTYGTGQSYANTQPHGYLSHNTPRSHSTGQTYANNQPHGSPPRGSGQPHPGNQSYQNNQPHMNAPRTTPQSYSNNQSYPNTQSRPNNQSYPNTQPRMSDPRPNTQPQMSTQPQQATSGQSGRKKGMGWPYDNPASLFPLFNPSSPSVHWLMNWELWVPQGLPNTIEWIPVVRTPAEIKDVVPKLTDAITNQRRTVPALLGFNEPEVPKQANMSVDDAVRMWRDVIVPAKHQFNLRLGSPCMSSDTSKSKPWLSQFFNQLQGRDEVDFVVLHYYGPNVEDMKRFLQDMHDTYRKPIWLNEFACSKLGNGQASEGEVMSFIQEAIPWLEGTDWIERYAYFGMGAERSVTPFVGEASNFLSVGGDPNTDGKRLSGVAQKYLCL